MFEQFVTTVGIPNVSWKARTKWSELAFAALYGLCGWYFVSSVNSVPSIFSAPYTSSVLMW